MKKISEWEKDIILVSLVTTKKMARQVLAGNKAMLDAWYEDYGDDFYGVIECPHCQEINNNEGCRVCRWMLLDADEAICLTVAFGGVLYKNTLVNYRMNGEGFLDRKSNNSSDFDSDTVSFLQGHITWAKRILDGTYVEYAKRNGIKRPVRNKETGIWEAK